MNVQRRRTARIFALLLAAIVVVLVTMATIPVSSRDLAPHARPLTDYATAVASIAQRNAADRTVAPNGQSILLAHAARTPVVVLLLHGYTNSPFQFDSLARMLYRDGYNVYVPRLPHHAEGASGAAALGRITAEELRAAADSAMDLVHALGDTTVVVGLSLGGTMAAWIAQNRADARRVVIVAPLIAIDRLPRRGRRQIMNLALRLPDITRGVRQDATEPDRELGWSTHAVAQILRLGAAVEDASAERPSASRWIAILLNAHDRTIAQEPVLTIAGRWRKSGAVVGVYRLSAMLGLPHDVIDPRQTVRRLDVVYPAIIGLVRGASRLMANR